MYVKAHCFKQVIFDTKAALRRDDIDPKEAMKKTVLVKPGTTNPYECVNKNTVLQLMKNVTNLT